MIKEKIIPPTFVTVCDTYVQWNMSATTTSAMKFITGYLVSNVF